MLGRQDSLIQSIFRFSSKKLGAISLRRKPDTARKSTSARISPQTNAQSNDFSLFNPLLLSSAGLLQ